MRLAGIWYRSIKEEHDIKCRRHKRFKVTTDSDHNKRGYPNLLKQQFGVNRPNCVWVSDITYVWTDEGWLYAAGVKDLYTKELVGYAMGKRMTADLVCKALNKAIKDKRPSQELIVHSDIGGQYCSNKYRKIISRHGFKGSMSAKGNCFDNAPIENFWGVLKNELVYHHNYKTRFEAINSIMKYIEFYYNEERLAKHCFAATQGESYARVEREFKRVWGLDRQDNCGLIITVRLRNQNLPSLNVRI
ncbi:Integrase core domain [Psychrobacter phenylpyruvicus]|uniref:Integrase core domain n=1 Tax=Psychrobacter phenylpyruvicus TaxID=29432 RepID=A0A379LGP7_9GAMM|nr:Integrase core domain [Psychrobacter phenylpyruvicus]